MYYLFRKLADSFTKALLFLELGRHCWPREVFEDLSDAIVLRGMVDEASAELDTISIKVGGVNPASDSISALEDDVFDAIFTENGRCSDTRNSCSNNNYRENVVHLQLDNINTTKQKETYNFYEYCEQGKDR